jgi:nitroreductase
MELKKMIFSAALGCIAIVTALYCQFPARSKKRIDRTPEYADIDALFIERWSPRAMSGEAISDNELMPLFEAARWAPSSYNEQPWRFLYAKRDTPEWATFFDLLVPFNQEWCKNGAALVVICSKNSFDRGGLNVTHSLDTGAAWQNLALQGHLKGFVVHGMGGFDHEKARSILHIPDDYTIEAMAVIGRPGDPKNLPDYMRKIEKPSGRKYIKEIVCEGNFKV